MTEQHEVTPRRWPGQLPRFPLRHLEVGDTYFCAGAQILQVHNIVAKWKPKKFRCRTMSINGVPGVYVVRIA